jgi:hypothetical protein
MLTSGWCDSDKTSDHALDSSNNGRLLEEDDIQSSPGEQRNSSSNVGVENGSAGIWRGGIWITSVEAVPADPEDTAADQSEENVVRLEVLTILLETRANPPSSNESSSSRGDVDNVSTGVIDHTTLPKETTAPKREGAWMSTSDESKSAFVSFVSPIVYEKVNQSGTKTIQARKFMRQRNAPAMRIRVIAAKTNWK